MKWKLRKFNKIIGTEFRVKNILNLYTSIANWLVNSDPNDINEEKFRKWIQESGIYKYRTQKKIKRLEMLKLRIIQRFKLISESENGKYKFNCENEDIGNYVLNALTKVDGLTKKSDIEPCIAFKAMLDFMIKYPNLNDAHKIFHSFCVYIEEDNFFELYNDNIIEKIVNKNVKNGYQYIKDLSNGKGCEKPKNIKKICKKILENKLQFQITYEEFNNARKHFLSNFQSHKEFEKFIRNESYDNIAKKIVLNMISRNFNYEFFDIFNRLLFNFGISPSSGSKVERYLNDNIQYNKNNDQYFVVNNQISKSYPYDQDKVNKILNDINEKNFEFIEDDINISNLPRADIVEYFVNIKFCYLMNIPASECKKYINTHLTNKLYPVSHASGRKSDMNFWDDKTLCGVETTIHSTINDIIKHEFHPATNHLLSHESGKINNVLVLVQKFGSKNDKLVDWFNRHGSLEFNKYNKKFQFKTYNFKELSELDKFKLY